MIQLTAPVLTVLASGIAWYADLYTFTLHTGEVIRITSSDHDISWDGQVWASPAQSGAPLIERGDITFEAGLTVDQLTLTVYSDAGSKVSGMSWPAALRVGLFDGADVILQRAIGPLGGDVVGVIPRFAGKVGPCVPGRVSSTITVDSMLAYLRAPVPRNVYQPGCANTMYDAACGLNRAAYESIVTVVSITADALTVAVTPAMTASRYLGGFARFVGTGANAGQQVTVSDNSESALSLLSAFPAPLSVGQTLAVAPGCSKSMAACEAHDATGWRDRYRGYPYVPEPETQL